VSVETGSAAVCLREGEREEQCTVECELVVESLTPNSGNCGKVGLNRRPWTSWTDGPTTAGSSGSPLTLAGQGGTGHGAVTVVAAVDIVVAVEGEGAGVGAGAVTGGGAGVAAGAGVVGAGAAGGAGAIPGRSPRGGTGAGLGTARKGAVLLNPGAAAGAGADRGPRSSTIWQELISRNSAFCSLEQVSFVFLSLNERVAGT